ncbi:MucBP domain-containing protein [Enterococcus faecalis]|nr:MucBP domain-containing protein [Enterococcus faecalis]EJW9248345.1 MucBP domain-containing protein [Enterococcus faecalis]
MKYLDADGDEIHEFQTISGNVGEAYDASTDKYKLAIDGYTLDTTKLPDNATGTLSDTVQTVTYVYTKNPVRAAAVTVKYLDVNGDEIHEFQTISGNVGDSYDAATVAYKLAIDGYTLDESKLPSNVTGTLSDIEQTVTYVYTKDLVKAEDVAVKYVDQDGAEIHDAQTISGNVGDSYDAATVAYKLAIDGYTLDESKLPSNATGTLSDIEQTVTYIYTVNLNHETIDARDSTLYVGDSWKAEDNFISATDKVGTSIDFNTSMISDTVDTSKAGAYPITYTNGSATKTITVTVKEKDTPIVPDTPVTPVTPDSSDPIEPNQAHTDGTDSPESSTSSLFPQTGEEMTRTGLFIGIALIAMSSLFYFADKKRKPTRK